MQGNLKNCQIEHYQVSGMNRSATNCEAGGVTPKCNSQECKSVINNFNLTPSVTRFLDGLLRQTKADLETLIFIQCCQRLYNGTRFRTSPFRNLLDEINAWPGWKEVSDNFKEYLSEFHGMVEYVVRRIFKAFYRNDSNALFQ